MRVISQWEREFSILVVVSIIFSGISYGIQFYLLGGMGYDRWNISSYGIRTTRMIIIYVIPVLYFKRRHNGSWRDLGVLPSKKYPILSTIGGLLVYSIAAYVFVSNRIGFYGWYSMPLYAVIFNQIFIGIMASITDFWTRGFILLELADRYNHRIAIIGQNIVWFVLHIYEIGFLTPYIGWIWGTLLTLTLGVTGDLIALKTRSITGLMLGHVLLNVAIVLASKGILL